MKREWQGLSTFLIAIAATWFFVAFIAFIVIAATTEVGSGPDRGMTTPGFIALAAWIGPFAVGAIGAAIIYAVKAIPDVIPRRVIVPLTEDWRAIHAKEQKRDAQ